MPSTAPCRPTGRLALGGRILLAGHSVASRQLRPGQRLNGTLEWQAVQTMDTDYTVFVQIVGPQGPIGQTDSQPRAGAYPTSYWEPGEVVADRFASDPGRTVARPAPVIAGMYDANGQRLARREQTISTWER